MNNFYESLRCKGCENWHPGQEEEEMVRRVRSEMDEADVEDFTEGNISRWNECLGKARHEWLESQENMGCRFGVVDEAVRGEGQKVAAGSRRMCRGVEVAETVEVANERPFKSLVGRLIVEIGAGDDVGSMTAMAMKRAVDMGDGLKDWLADEDDTKSVVVKASPQDDVREEFAIEDSAADVWLEGDKVSNSAAQNVIMEVTKSDVGEEVSANGDAPGKFWLEGDVDDEYDEDDDMAEDISKSVAEPIAYAGFVDGEPKTQTLAKGLWTGSGSDDEVAAKANTPDSETEECGQESITAGNSPEGHKMGEDVADLSVEEDSEFDIALEEALDAYAAGELSNDDGEDVEMAEEINAIEYTMDEDDTEIIVEETADLDVISRDEVSEGASGEPWRGDDENDEMAEEVDGFDVEIEEDTGGSDDEEVAETDICERETSTEDFAVSDSAEEGVCSEAATEDSITESEDEDLSMSEPSIEQAATDSLARENLLQDQVFPDMALEQKVLSEKIMHDLVLPRLNVPEWMAEIF